MKWLLKHVQTLVTRYFYYHGLFCASHPYFVFMLTAIVVTICCMPLVNMSFSDKVCQEYRTPTHHFTIPPLKQLNNGHKRGPADGPVDDLTSDDNESLDFVESWNIPARPLWFAGKPVAYIQQFIVKAVVTPWDQTKLIPTDAFRTPLSRVFVIQDRIHNFLHFTEDGQVLSLKDLCYTIPELDPVYLDELGPLPRDGCMLLSPAQFWSNSIDNFNTDGTFIETIYKKWGPQIVPSLKEMLFGIPWRQTGIHKFYIRSRQRIISYTLSVVYEHYNPSFVEALAKDLQKSFTNIELNTSDATPADDNIVHVYFKDDGSYLELTPLFVTYSVLFLYILFSVKKITMVKSKFGLAVCAIVSLIFSLLMSVGVCTFFGLETSLKGSDIFPYLVVVIGLENILILTKSVVSTPFDQDVRSRIAQGISKEGWFITKNLLWELIILMGGYFTFVSEIQDFCLFALVALLTDFFLQMVFFLTVLSIDIRRLELSDLPHKKLSDLPSIPQSPNQIPRTRSAPRNLNKMATDNPAQADVESPPTSTLLPKIKLPKRLRVIYFWARTRIVQRAIMALTVVWILVLVHQTVIVHHLSEDDNESLPTEDRSQDVTPDEDHKSGAPQDYPEPDPKPGAKEDQPVSEEMTEVKLDTLSLLQQFLKKDQEESDGAEGSVEPEFSSEPLSESDPTQASRVENNDWNLFYNNDGQPDRESWKYDSNKDLLHKHSHRFWPTVFNYYNVSLIGRFISILPTVNIAVSVGVSEAIAQRHSVENDIALQREFYLAPFGHDPRIDREAITDPDEEIQRKLIYTASMLWEFHMIVLMSVLSGAFFVMMLTLVYKCMCTRNYGKVNMKDLGGMMSSYIKKLSQSVPLALNGHLLDIECIVSDGSALISSCLGGEIRVWDVATGECLTTFQRSGSYHRVGSCGPSQPPSQTSADRHSYGSLTNRHATNSQEIFRSFPDLTSTIETNFNELSNYTGPKTPPSTNLLESFSYGDIANETSNVDRDLQLAPANSVIGIRHPVIEEGTGFNFSNFEHHYKEHARMISPDVSTSTGVDGENSGDVTWNELSEAVDGDPLPGGVNQRGRSFSVGDMPHVRNGPGGRSDRDIKRTVLSPAPPIWCLTCHQNLIAAGCRNGIVELWDSASGALRGIFDSGYEGVTSLSIEGKILVVARLSGFVDFVELTANVSTNQTLSHTPRKRTRGHKRSQSQCEFITSNSLITCQLIQRIRAHQKSISAMDISGNRVITASQDRTLKVFSLDDGRCIYTLHGHTDRVTCLHVEKGLSLLVASGSADTSVRIWDVITGACLHQLRHHDNTISTITSTRSHVISLGCDDVICIWDRWHGYIVHSIQMDAGCFSNIGVLTNSWIITGGEGCLVLWDVSSGEMFHVVPLGGADMPVIRQLLVMDSSTVACCYGNEIRIVTFPSVLEKMN